MNFKAIKRIYCRALYGATGGFKVEDLYRRKDDDVIGKEVVLVNEDCFTGKTDKKASLFGGRILRRNQQYKHSFYYVEWYYRHDEIVDVINNIYGSDKFTLESHDVVDNVSSHNIDDLRIVSLSQSCIKTISENGLFYFIIVIGFIAWMFYCVAVGAWKDIIRLFN